MNTELVSVSQGIEGRYNALELHNLNIMEGEGVAFPSTERYVQAVVC